MQNVGLWALGFQMSSPSTPDNGSIYLWGALVIGVLGLLVAFLYSRSVLAMDAGTQEMQAISNAIREGAEAFMSRQYGTIAIIAVVLAILLYIGYRLSPFTAPFANKVVVSFLIGAICSGLSGLTGMFVSIRTNIRAASAARTSLGRALQTALRGGAVTGLVVVALSLLGIGSPLLPLRRPRASASHALSTGRLRLRRIPGRALRSARRRHLHQGCRRRRRPRRQSRGRHPGGRPTQSCRHRRPRR